jgi:hypothetical protein
MDARDTGADAGVNIDADTVWLTYAELGIARGTNAAAAKRLAMRRRWRRQAGNDGTTRVSVPVSEVRHWKGDTSAHTRVDAGVNTGDDTEVNTSVIKALEAAVASLTDRSTAAETRADRAEIRAESVEKRANEAERALSEERRRADRLELTHDRLETERDAAEARSTQAVADAQAAQQAAEELRQAEAARRGQGRWARLRVAWRGE